MRAFWIGVVLFALFGAVVLCAHFSFLGFYLNLEIKPVDLAILAVNLFIALFLSQYFLEKSSNLRAEKDLLISDLRDLLGTVKSSREILVACQDAVRMNKNDKKLILSTIRRIANGVSLVESALAMSQCSKLLKGYDITDAYLEYKAAATGGTFPTKAYSQDQISDQERTYRKLVSRLHALLFAINRHP